MARRKAAADDDPLWTLTTKPAPGELKIIHALVSTLDPITGADAIAAEGQLVEWLAHWRLVSASTQLTSDDVEQTLVLRHALLSLIRSSGDPKALAALDRVAARIPLRLCFNAVGVTRLEPFAEGIGEVLGHLLRIVAQAFDNNRFSRFKICGNSECRKVFYDHSGNRVGAWCSKKPCANSVHGKAFRRRYPNYYPTK